MKNVLVLFAAVIFILQIFQLTVICENDNWVGRCISESHSILGCATRNFDPLIPVDQECCKILHDFDRTCVSKSKSFEHLDHSLLWIKNRCAHAQPHTSPNPPSVSPPSPPSPTPSPPSPTPTPPSPTTSPPSPTPTPPASSSSSSSSTPPREPSSDQTPWQRLQVYPPEPLPMPDVTGIQGTWRGCGEENAAKAETQKLWEFPNNRTSCTLRRSIGIYCDTGKALDIVVEFCCVLYKDPHADPVGKCTNVKPLIAPPGPQSPPPSPPPPKPVSVVPPKPLPMPDASGLWGQWTGCGEANAAEKSVEQCWNNDKDNSKTCCTLARHIGVSCKTGESFDTLHEYCCLIYNDPRAHQIPGKCMDVKPSVIN